MADTLEGVKRLINNKQWVEAMMALDPIMSREPNHPMALFCLGQILLETDKQSIAYPIYKHLLTLEPHRPEVWINMGKAAGELHFYEEEEKCFRKALKLAERQNNEVSKQLATQNLGTCAVHQTKPEKAIHWAKKALALKDTRQSKVDIGFSYLMLKNYAEGWKNYNMGLGVTTNRDIVQFKDEPEWDGSPDKRIVIYGEQGLGDQIAFAGAVRDARRISKQVTLHVNPKLKNLFINSFILDVHGYGPDDDMKWLETLKLDASVSMSRLQEYFRDDISKFTGKPYLMASMEKRIQWRALLESLGDKPKIGIAWTGGLISTQGDARSTNLETFAPIITDDFEWVCLEYRDKTSEIAAFQEKHGIKIHDYSWATRTNDYDDTAALVKELDLVIAVPTSVVHLAGALGTKCWCIVHENPHFMFGMEGDSMPFYNSVKLFRRNNDWDRVISDIGGELDDIGRGNSSGSGARRITKTGDPISSDSIPIQRTVLHN